MKYLITGGNGFIGKFLKEKLLSQNHEVKTLGISKNNDYSIDLTKDSIELSEDFDVILHSASIVHNQAHALSFNSQFILQDLEITLNLLRSINQVSYKKLIYLSSVSVYGVDFGQNIDITQKLYPK